MLTSNMAASLLPAGTWTADPLHSTVEFHVGHLGLVTVKGFLLSFRGQQFGFDTFIFWPAGNVLNQVERFAREVVPSVREAIGVHSGTTAPGGRPAP